MSVDKVAHKGLNITPPHPILYSYTSLLRPMPFEPVPVTTEDLVTYLSDKVGTEVNTKQLFEASEHFNCSLATVKEKT